MEHKLNCAVVKDLLPNYIEKLTSEETGQEIREHLSECVPCSKVYEEMTQEVPHDSLVEEAKDLSRFLRKTKAVAAVKISILAMMILGIVVNLIVDVAINRKITWSILVIASVVYALSIYLTSVWGGKHKFLKASVCASVLVIPLLWVIAIFCQATGADGSWLIPVAIPITCLWLAIVWAGILVYLIFKANVWFSVGLVMTLAIPANILTNAIASNIAFCERMCSLDSMINALAYALCAIVTFVIAYLRRGKRI